MAMNMRRALLLLPIPVFVVLIGVLLAGFFLGRHDIHPSALIGKEFPAFESMKLRSGAVVTNDDLKGELRLVNIWGSWCVACVDEHDVLTEIVRTKGVSLIGVNYKDERTDALAWLARYGDPYEYHLVDPEGDLGVNLGVYGAPETFVVDATGIVRFKHIGALTHEIFAEQIEPLLSASSND